MGCWARPLLVQGGEVLYQCCSEVQSLIASPVQLDLPARTPAHCPPAGLPARPPARPGAQDWIGKPFGTKVRAKPPASGWVYLLAPTPELWTQVGG